MAAETAIRTTAQPAARQSDPSRAVEVTGAPNRRGCWTYRPHVDVFDTPDEVLLMADLPGAQSETIDVSLEAGVLTIQAEVAARQNGSAQCAVHEYGIGGFHRRFEIDESIDAEHVSAEYRNGSLTVHLPKVQHARRRRIPVSG